MQQTLSGKKILLGITGSIAAFKCPQLIRLLRMQGAEVRVVMSAGASNFVTSMTLQALSEHSVLQQLMDETNEVAMSHIELARWTDLILIAPATAHFMAKLALGLADDLLNTLCLATTAPIAIAPAMNQQMWLNSATQANLKILKSRNIQLFGPDIGVQACGETGTGRMLEPEIIIQEVTQFFNKANNLSGKHILITAGPTQEALDPVRYLTNRSSGKMGYAIAAAAAAHGAKVSLIAGPTALACPAGVTRIEVTSATEMYTAVMGLVQASDVFIGAAAVADYRVKSINAQKIKKTAATLKLELIPNPDILAAVAQLKKRPFVIGFAAETENVLANAKKKLQSKKLDVIIANQVGAGRGFNTDENELTVITANTIKALSFASKSQLADELINFITPYITPQLKQAAKYD